MKIGVSSYSYSRHMNATGADYFAVAELAKKQGFDGIEFLPLTKRPEDATVLDTAKALRKHCEELGIEICAYTVGADLLNGSEGCTPEEEVERLKKCADVCAELGAKVMRHDVVWKLAPGMRCWHDAFELIVPRIREITEYAAEKGVRPALENLRRTNYIARLFHENRDLPLYYCWDSGHEICYTPGVDHVALFPEKLVCTHIHDNSGVYMMDDHWLPFDGAMDWERKARFIRESGYTGALTMELARPLAKYDHLSDEEFIAEAYKRIQKFAEMCK